MKIEVKEKDNLVLHQWTKPHLSEFPCPQGYDGM